MEPMLETPPRRDVSAVLWLGLPLGTIAGRLLLACLPEASWDRLMAGETGLIEGATVVFLLPAIVLGVLIFRRRRELPRGVGWFMLLTALAALYFAGEECSWGQVYVGWRTPEAIARINDQNEFNIHRTSNLFNNIPRTLTTVAVLVGGGILPLAPHVLRKPAGWIRRLIEKGRNPAGGLYWIVPNYRLVVVSLMAICLREAHKLAKSMDAAPAKQSYLGKALFRDSGEFKELYFALAILFYLLSVYLRMGKKKPRLPLGRR